MEINLNELFPTGEAGSKTNVITVMQMPDSTENKIVTNMDMNIKFTD